ncbi:hypothetical protein MT487_10310 [Lachnospiraceae bacterium NSJ-171]|jgi:hypothetical protein|nr:hypothetical protein [Lachnospiraceae bacterium NSJ-171]
MKEFSRIQIIDKIVIGILPILIAVIGILIIPKNSITIDEGIENCKMMLDIWGVMLGFVITALSILLTVHENGYVKMLIDTGHFSTILFSYMCCCISLFIAVVTSIILIYAKYWNECIYMLFKGLIINTFLSLGFALFFMFKIILKNIY